MIHFYYIILIILSSIGTLYAPQLWARYKRYRTEIKRKQQNQFRTAVRTEVRKYLEELKTK